MNKFFFLIMLFVSFVQSYGQKIDYPLNNRVTINYQDYMVYAHFTREEGHVSIDDDKYYYWFSANDIKKTRGGYDGKILHGLFTAFYMNKSLKEKGKFRYGLKKGEWKEWYNNGELKEKSFYKKGYKSKAFSLFYTNGKVKQKGRYKKGELHGKLKTYDSLNVLVKTERYKKGILQPLKVKELKVKKRKSLFRRKTKAPKLDSLGMPIVPQKRRWFSNPFKKKDKVVRNSTEQGKSKKGKPNRRDTIRVRKMKKIVPADTNKSDI